MTTAATGKGGQTRAAIIDAALSLFEERGYDASTMRAIAERAGVSVGNAYYYFSSKDELIQGFYDRAADLHAERSAELLTNRVDLTDRVGTHLLAWVDAMAPFHEFAAVFFRNASDPASPLSPFSSDSEQARQTAVELWRSVIAGSDADIPEQFRHELPELLWLLQMAVVLFWVHDRTDDTVATRLVVARLVPMLVRALELSRLPELEATVADIVGLMSELRQLLAASPPA